MFANTNIIPPKSKQEKSPKHSRPTISKEKTQTKFKFFEDGSGKLFLNFATQICNWTPGCFCQCHTCSESRIR